MVKRAKLLFPALLCVSILSLSGCGSKKETDAAMKVDAKPAAMGPVESLDSKPLGISEGRTTEGMLPVYFDFDSSDVRKDQVSRVEVNADFIKNNPKYNPACI